MKLLITGMVFGKFCGENIQTNQTYSNGKFFKSCMTHGSQWSTFYPDYIYLNQIFRVWVKVYKFFISIFVIFGHLKHFNFLNKK